MTLSSPTSPVHVPASGPSEPEQKKLKLSSSEDDVATPDPKQQQPPQRYKRRKIALFLAYLGVGYQGMQKNPGAKTIEGDLEEALYLIGAIPEADKGNQKKFDWARSARTDKGVSAVGAVVSGRFIIDSPPGSPDFITRLNEKLPGQIRVFGYKRVTGSFNAKKFCDRRRYVYLVPVFALDEKCHVDRESVVESLGSGNELVKCNECSDRGRKVEGLMGRRINRCRNNVSNASNGDKSNGKENNSMDVETPIELFNVIANETEGVTVSDVASDPRSISETKVVSKIGLVSSGSGGTLDNNGVDAMNTGSMLKANGFCGTGGVSSIPEGALENNGAIGSNDEMTLEANESSMLEAKKISVIEAITTKSGADIGSNVEVLKVNEGLIEDEVALDKSNLHKGSVNCSNGEMKGMTKNGSGFCYGEKEMERFNRILNNFVGTHNFHNFTARIKAEDPSVIRYIMSFNATCVVTVNGMDFVKCEVVGQSFMLHQIRKMIGLAVAIMRNRAPESLIVTAFGKDVNINVPTAPEVGLYLDECFFTSYNQKWKDTHEEVSMKGYEDEAEDFKMKQIYSHIAANEDKYGGLAVWLHSLNHRNYPDLNYKKTSEAEACSIEVTSQVESLLE